MFFGIALLLRRRKQIILGVVIDHGLGKDLVIFVTFGMEASCASIKVVT